MTSSTKPEVRTLSQKDRCSANDNMHQKFSEVWTFGFLRHARGQT